MQSMGNMISENKTSLAAKLRRLQASQWQMPFSTSEIESRMFGTTERLLRANGRRVPWTNDLDRLMIRITAEDGRIIVDIEPTDWFTDAYCVEFDETGCLVGLECYAAEPLLTPDM